jgi:FKBP-type peptidyl-prolyl cis-trans isomerase SlyD
MRPQILSFYCEVQDKLGNVLSSSFNREVRTEHDAPGESSGADPTFQRVVQALKGMRKGESTEIHLPAEDAYGLYDERLVINIPVGSVEWHGPIQIGQEVMAETSEGSRHLFRVTGMNGSSVILDGNHPLAGQDLVVRVQVTSSRPDRKTDTAMKAVQGKALSGRILH